MRHALALATLVLAACGGSGTGTAAPDEAPSTPRAAEHAVAYPGTAAPTPAPAAADVDRARPPTTPDPSARMEAGFFVADGAPSPAACTTDADCQGNTLPAEGGCCQDPTMLGAYTSSYRAWLGTWRAAHCEGVVCPPALVPTRPADCYFDVHCAAGACANTCRF